MDVKEQIKQREIGQQIMIVRMVHDISEKALKSGVSFINRSEVAKWTHKSKEEIDLFLEDIASLHELNICADAASKYANNLSGDAQAFFALTFKKHGYLFIESILNSKESGDSYLDRMENLAKINAKNIIDKEINVDDEIMSAARLEDSLKFYFSFYIGRIIDIVNKGYDWDVINEMLGESNEFFELIKSYVIHILRNKNAIR